jgi:hypothetical protein
MQRRLPHESEYLIEQLASWIDWRYSGKERLVLTSAPTLLPPELVNWRQGAVWRLAWQADGAAVLYGLAPGEGPTKYFVTRHAADKARTEALFELMPDTTWRLLEGDGVILGPLLTPFELRKAA